MNVTKKVSIDLMQKQNVPSVDAVQNDSNSRKVEIHLFSGGEQWTIPSGLVASVSYSKPDGTTGWYNRLSNVNANACSYSGNVVTAILDVEMLTVAGEVHMAVVLQDSSTLDRIATFPINVNVSPDPSEKESISNNYYKYKTIGDMNSALDGFDKELDEFRGSLRPFPWAVAPDNMETYGWDTFLDLPTNYFYRCSYTLPESFGLPVRGSSSTLVILDASNLDREIYWNRLYICTVRRGATENQTYIAYTDDGVGLDGVVWRQVMTVSDLEKTGLIAGGNVTAYNYATVLPDLDGADINRVYDINNCLQDIANIPDTTATSGTLLYYNGDTSRQNDTNKSFGVQILTATDHKTYLRSCWAGTWTAWRELTDIGVSQKIEALSVAIGDVDGVTIQAVDNNVMAWNYSTVLPDLDTADINRVYSIHDCLQDIQHIPETTSTSGTLLYYNGDASRQDNPNKSFGVQILTATDHKTYLRSCWAGTWTEWEELSNAELIGKVGDLEDRASALEWSGLFAGGAITSYNYATALSDMDTADINKVYAINGCLQNIQHIPNTTATSGTLMYYNGETSRRENTNKSFGVQILTATDHKTYLRSCWAGTWTEWGELSGKDDGRVIPNYANFSVFDRFGTIGDSLSVGTYRQADGTDTYNESKSWGEHIVRNCHNQRLSLGFGGATTTSWIQGVSWTDNGLAKALLPENQCDAYIIALGYNDNNTSSSSGGVTLGNMDDIDEDDPDNNAVSYYGNMDKILRKLHGAFPDAKLFVLNNPYYNTNLAASYNVALEEVTTRLAGSNVYLIDLYGKYSSIYKYLAADREGNHYHPQIYQYMGMLIATAISDYMLEHLAEFKYV